MHRILFLSALLLVTLLLRPAPAQIAPTGQWRAVDILGKGVIARMQPTLELSGDGRLAGHGMCNRYFAAVKIDGANISVSPVGSTRMDCSAQAMKMEARYFEALESAHGWRINDTTKWLELRNRDGAIVLKFERI